MSLGSKRKAVRTKNQQLIIIILSDPHQYVGNSHSIDPGLHMDWLFLSDRGVMILFLCTDHDC